MSRRPISPPADPAAEEQLTARLQNLVDHLGDPPDHWPRLESRLAAPLRRHRPIAWGIGIVAGLLLILNPLAYLLPRLQMTVAAMVAQVPSEDWDGALIGDSGVFSLWREGALQPVQARTTVHGVTLTVLGAYFDDHSTVIPFSVSGPPPAGVPLRAITVPWEPVLVASPPNGPVQAANSEGNFGNGPPSGAQAVTLSDQFGSIGLPDSGNYAESFNAMTGLGVLKFPGFPAWMRRTGLRLTFQVPSMVTVEAPRGPLGSKKVFSVSGPWRISFTVLPPSQPSLTLTPRTKAHIGHGILTLERIQTGPDGSWISMSTTGSLSLSPHGSAGWGSASASGQSPQPEAFSKVASVTTPTGQTVSFLDGHSAAHSATFHFPPLTAAGRYRLTGVLDGTRWTLVWRQTAWHPGLSWRTPKVSPLYQGTDLTEVAHTVGFSIVPPPVGISPKEITVTATSSPVRHPGVLPRQIAMILPTSGGTVEVDESPAWLTPLPRAQTVAQFLATSNHSGEHVSCRRISLSGIPGQLWNFTYPMGPGKKSGAMSGFSILDLYPPWGSLQFQRRLPQQLSERLQDHALLQLAESMVDGWQSRADR